MSKHIPTPWVIKAHNTIYKPAIYSEDRLVSTIRGGFTTEAEEYANAEFIVRACNAHDELVAALEGILYNFLRETDVSDCKLEIFNAKAALAKAKGE